MKVWVGLPDFAICVRSLRNCPACTGRIWERFTEKRNLPWTIFDDPPHEEWSIVSTYLEAFRMLRENFCADFFQESMRENESKFQR